MLDFESHLFTCLGWNEGMWESSDGFPLIWDASWEDIGPERRVCAAALGYDEVHWNVSLLNSFEANRPGNGFLIFYFYSFDFLGKTPSQCLWLG